MPKNIKRSWRKIDKCDMDTWKDIEICWQKKLKKDKRRQLPELKGKEKKDTKKRGEEWFAEEHSKLF